MAWLLHFTGEGTKLMSGVHEYIILSEEEKTDDEIKDMVAPGFELNSKTDLDINEPPCSVPYNAMLVPRY